MKKYRLLIVLMLAAMSVAAQAQNIRYVSTTGAYANDGTNWANAKNNIQDAINDLVNNGLDGEVWVAAGTYTPTESTESSGGSTLYMSFKIPAGITIRGGFKADAPEWNKSTWPTKEAYINADAVRPKQDFNSIGWFYKNHTILSGDLSTKPEFAWDPKKEQWNPTFFGNSYHVVWFAMNGFDANGRANGLAKPAAVEGFVIEDGHAYNNSLTERHHNAYGGGAYMVANATMQNCYFRNCDASRDGGAIYMDGGGMVIHSYVSDSQALGIGVDHGYGGGICMEGSDKPGVHPIVVSGSGITNCVGRMGGGIATKVNKNCLDQRDNVAINATLVNNNTATTEGGGVYMLNGGAIANATIVRNKCNGTGVTSKGMVTGRAGGLYARDNASIANCVIWGNKCEANRDVQYAASRSTASADLKPIFYYNAISKSDLTDWSGTTKKGIKSLADSNYGIIDPKNKIGFPIFQNPTTVQGAGHSEKVSEVDIKYDLDHDGDKTGTEKVTLTMGMLNLIKYSWKVMAESAMNHAGINTYDITKSLPNKGSLVPEVSTDITGNPYNPRSTQGAYTSSVVQVAPQIVGTTANFYVDPDYYYGEHVNDAKGTSWSMPTRFLANVFEFIKQEQDSVATSKTCLFSTKGITTINVYVKQGTVNNTDSYRTGRVREIAIEIPSNVNVYGSYDASLTGTDLSKRNPVLTPTIISGALFDDYKYYVSHLIKIENKQNILLDGFKLSFANAWSKELDSSGDQVGAAITLKGSTTGIVFKNLTVSNCKATMGPAVYADASTASFENCIFHNNTAVTNEGGSVINASQWADRGVIYGANGSNLTFDHCDVVRNVGYASFLDGTTHNTWTNTIFYGNLKQVVDDTNTDVPGPHELGLPSFSGTTANATGDHCMFDASSASFSSQFGGNDTGNPYQYNLQYKFQDGTLQGYPRFINPTRNAGVSEEGDVTYYGRSTSFEPHNNNPVVNMASTDGSHLNWGKDITTITTRDFGGLPDIGAVENHNATAAEGGENAYTDGQAAYGEVVYVRDYGTTHGTKNTLLSTAQQEEFDGSSWEHAIDGNMLYTNYTLEQTPVYDPANEKEVTKEVDVFDGWKISIENNNQTYYLSLNGTALTATTNEDDATHWTVSSTQGGTCLDPMSAGNTRYIFAKATNGNTYYIRIQTSSVSASTTATIARIVANGTSGYYIRYNGTTARYLRYNGSLGVSTTNSSNTWQFTKGYKKETQTVIDKGEPIRWEETRHYTGTNLNGLQFAVNLQNGRYTGGLHKEVWVGAGTYSKDPETGDKSCFIIKDGVDVYGAFPKTGNPAKDQRQALVSQYVKVTTGYDPAEYETIIQPITTTIQSTTARRVLGQPYDNNPFNKGGYTKYDGALWDGFTVRFGVISNENVTVPERTGGGAGNGGGGVVIYDNVTLRNMVITNNTILRTTAKDCLGGGVYMNGGSIEQCYIINNVNQGWTGSAKTQAGECYGGGITIENGTMFNSVIANNLSYAQHADGGGVFLYNANFFNNTIANNSAQGSSRCSGGIALWTNTQGGANRLTVYNTISVNNVGYIKSPYSDQASTGDKNIAIQAGGNIELFNCLTENAVSSKSTSTKGDAIITFTKSPSENTPTKLFEALGSYSDRGNNTTNISSFKDCNLRLKNTATAAINAGVDAPTINDVTYNLVEYTDMDYRERIQDCTIDIGAYEYNGSLDITPETKTVGGVEQAIFYVTPEGYGTASGRDPENAACASKLQKVIDAAGRYKYLNPTKQVIVKVANDYALDNDGDDDTYFTYYASRTTDFDSQDVRIWSIIVPRGVEIWGGYTDVARTNHTRANWSNSDNGFYGAGGNDARDIVNNPTYFDSYYVNKQEKSSANTYHVITFTDHIFDGDGYPYLTGDVIGDASSYATHNVSGSLNESAYLHMSDVAALQGNVTAVGGGKTISARAVVDGIFISGGQADAKDFSGYSAQKNINSYGGAAIVTDYAHVRNCILTGNRATYGGALALKDKALVSGSLFIENNADKHGGALYVFEEGVSLSDGTTINTGTDSDTAPHGMTSLDQEMPHIFTSTIVNNHAMQGGGVWFSEGDVPNVRFNSTIIWGNNADDQANVAGNAMPNKPEDDLHSIFEYYPFAYSAVQNLRLSGANNLSVDIQNKKGVRFASADTEFDPDWSQRKAPDDEANIGKYYGLSDYSVLIGKGMPTTDYTNLINSYAVSTNDFAAVSRFINSGKNERHYIEIGARAFDKVMRQQQLMLRLFVAQPDDIDVDAAEKLMNPDLSTGTEDEKKIKQYYSQEGSSFAYPFQDLQDALDYIYLVRKDESVGGMLETYATNNLPFEIYVAKGSYYPTRDLAGNYGQSLANTFAVPEGVSIIGGFAVDQLGDGNFFGAGYAPKAGVHENYASQEFTGALRIEDDEAFLSANVTPLTGADPEIGGYTLKQLSMTDMLDARPRADINLNNIIEPWEFVNQTVLSGNATSAENAGVYHVVTAIADQNVVGMLPKISYLHADHNGSCKGYDDHEEGQTIHLNGLTITGGYAHHYVPGSLDEYGKYIYYQGGGVQIDGNRYNDNYNKYVEGQDINPSLKHPAWVDGTTFNDAHKAAFGVGYRDIPLSVVNCKFLNNQAGYGGAISSNGTVDIFASSLEQNLAIQKDEIVNEGGGDKIIQYPGLGGAILATHQLSAFNTLFANNEARSDTYRNDPYYHKSFRVQNPESVGGIKVQDGGGGAIMMGTAGIHHIVNCDFVKNKANMYPAIFTLNPDTHPYIMAKLKGESDANAALAYGGITTPKYSQCINSVFWGNEVHPQMMSKFGSNETFKFASQLAVNVGLKGRYDNVKNEPIPYDPTFDTDNAPSSQPELDNSFDNECRFMESMWFCAYEDGKGFTPKNDYDCRDLDYKPFGHAFYQVNSYLQSKHGLGAGAYQNANILLDSENESLEGPNFVNPSSEAGIDGYQEGADWSPARLNNLTDAGSGRIEQKISSAGEGYSCKFVKYGDAKQGGGTWEVPAERVTEPTLEHPEWGYSNEKEGDYVTTGAYTMTHYIKAFPEYNAYLSLGNDYYMESAYTLDAPINVDGEDYYHQQLLRISYDPNPTHNQTYIDIGVYEYAHTQLMFDTDGDECDILWVSPVEKPDNGLPDGSAWTQPTSDLQRAIETLIASRNGHRKEIRLMDGTFTPIYTIDGNLSFYFDTKYQNGSVILPQVLDSNGDPTGEVTESLGVKSFTIKGGYSRNLFDQYDVNEYPAIIKGQKRSDENSNNWNHLFYIKDATQRLGNKFGYDDSNNFGAGATPKTIPIEIDGVTFINDQAKAGVDGAAIYYADQTSSEGVTTANISRITYYKTEAGRDAVDAGDISDVPTKFSIRETLTAEPTKYSYIENTNPAKFVMSKCTVYGSGSYNNVTSDGGDKTTTSAVHIGTGAGHTLFFNNVFHSNYGKPLVANNAVTVNNTFAKNGGFVDLKNETASGTESWPKSSIKNSVLWNNNWNIYSSQYGKQFELDGYTSDNVSGTIFARNAYNGAACTATDYDKFRSDGTTPTDIANANYNVNLASENSDVIYGPNFTDPNNADLSKRNFIPMPSLRLLNKGDKTMYNDIVSKPGVADNYYSGGGHDMNPAANIYDLAWLTTTQHDAGSSPRIVSDYIDLGAYEYQQQLDRVYYVDPNKSIPGAGTSWESPFCLGMIQDAIDLAGVYVVNNSKEINGKEAYVFVKGASGTNAGLHTNETITLRNGVYVIGSIGADYSEVVTRSNTGDPEADKAADDLAFDAFVKDMLAQREGVASNSASKTTVLGISTNGTGFVSGMPTVVDGFEVTAKTESNSTGKITAPVIKIAPIEEGRTGNPENDLSICLRNIIVRDNDASGAGVNVAELDNALMYEVLMRDNKVDNAQAVLQVGNHGYLVHGTIEGKTKNASGSEIALNGGADAAAETASHVMRSLVNYADDETTWKTLSGYNYPLDDKNLNYQLAEKSKHIDAYVATEPTLPANLTGYDFINYFGDRDILGNPRYIRGATSEADGKSIDRGAFETWRVDNNFICGDQGTVTTNNLIVGLGNEIIKKQHYPHDGSVVYIMEGKSLVIDPFDPDHEIKPTAHNPGFMLLKEGASCYGNGRPMTCAYLAVERIAKSEGNVVSMPFAMDYVNNVKVPTYDANGVLSLSNPSNPAVYTYNGAARADWQYNFRDTSSPCWQNCIAKVDANHGVLYVPGGEYPGIAGPEDNKKVLRFTAKGASMTDYIYTETTDASKTVTLTQHNAGGRVASVPEGAPEGANGNTANNADFTDADDMGWNAIGLPYLVSEYKPYQTATTAVHGEPNNGKYMMHTPKTLWMFYDGAKYSDGVTDVDGDGGFYSVSSWTDSDWHLPAETEARIWVGEGFFTQTATFDATEDVTFFRPVAPASFPALAPANKGKNDNVNKSATGYNTRYYQTTDVRPAMEEDFTGKQIVATRYYTADGVQHSRPVHGVTIQVDIYDDGSRQTRKFSKR